MTVIKTAEILCVGTEILIGDIVNTNAAFISSRLSALGISQYYQGVIGDNSSRLSLCIKKALRRCDLVILTGGLGPTYDDLTKETAAKIANVKTFLHEPSLERIKAFFRSAGSVMTDNNIKQAMIPEGATVFPNDHGTAPGIALEIPAGIIGAADDEPLYNGASSDTKTLILLPGPPREMKPMFINYAEPYLSARSGGFMISKNAEIFGIGESAAESLLADKMKASLNPTIAPYCGEGDLRIRVTARADSPEDALKLCGEAINELRKSPVGKYIYGVDTTLAEAVVHEAAVSGIKLTTAESCTGGLTAGAITAVPGSSEVFDGGAVTYSNEIKNKLLGVRKETLEIFGAVSPQTAREMACGAIKLTDSDISVSLTGIAGPGGGTKEKPVGLVYIAVASRAGSASSDKYPLMLHSSAQLCGEFKEENGICGSIIKCKFIGSRDHVRALAVKSALAALLSAVRNSKL